MSKADNLGTFAGKVNNNYKKEQTQSL